MFQNKASLSSPKALLGHPEKLIVAMLIVCFSVIMTAWPDLDFSLLETSAFGSISRGLLNNY